MNAPKNIAIADYDYHLPNDRIAKYPLADRDKSKLLVYRDNNISETKFYNIATELPNNSMLVFNNTKVIHARLFFKKETGSVIEVFCLEPWMIDIQTAFEQRKSCSWLCFIGNNKKWKDKIISKSDIINGKEVLLNAVRREAKGNAWIIDFSWNGEFSFADIIDKMGVIPLPPYLNREAEANDNNRYQTIYAKLQGSVAAPTAGLHFTDNVLDDLKSHNIKTEFVTLHVGAGTFKPVSSDTIGFHEMHIEKIQISRENITSILSHIEKPIISVGTTSVRTLESVYWFGVKLENDPNITEMHISQWDAYDLEDLAIPASKALLNVIAFLDQEQYEILYGETQLMIAPGYKYHIIDGIITNFHQPKSTLLLLVSALIGDDWKSCYKYAINNDFRFLSYGDSCLFLSKKIKK